MDTSEYSNILRYLETLQLPDLQENQRRTFKRRANEYIVSDELLYRKNKKNPSRPLRVIKYDERERILYNFHEDPLAGHFGFQETYRSISLKYYWPNMGNDIKEYVNSCDICQRRKKHQRNEP